MVGISGSQSLGRFVTHDGGATDIVVFAESLIVVVTVTPAPMDIGADDRVHAIKKKAASRANQRESLTQSTYRGVDDLSDRGDRSDRPNRRNRCRPRSGPWTPINRYAQYRPTAGSSRTAHVARVTALGSRLQV